MAVSCCAMQRVLKCKMETMNLFIYLLRGRFLPPQLPLLGSCLDASNHLHRLVLCDNKSKDPSKTGITFQLQHRLVLTLPSQHKANLGTFFACFFFFFNYMDLWMVSGSCAAIPPKLWLLHTVCQTHINRRHPAAPCPFPVVSNS